MFAFRHDVFAVHFAVGYQLADVLHHRVVRPDGVSRDYVHVGQFAGNRNGLGAGNQGFLLVNLLLFLDRYCQRRHLTSPCLQACRRAISPCSDFQGFGDLFLILAAITEAMGPLLDRFGLLNGGLQPFQVGVRVFLERLPLAGVIVEFGLVHHGDAVLHRANVLRKRRSRSTTPGSRRRFRPG